MGGRGFGPSEQAFLALERVSLVDNGRVEAKQKRDKILELQLV
jgi:hypothetical protein